MSSSWQVLSLVASLLLLGSASCKSKQPVAADAAPPAVTAPLAPPPVFAPATAPAAASTAPSPTAAKVTWPLWKYESLSAGNKVALPAGASVVELSSEPRGRYVVALLAHGGTARSLALWDGRGTLRTLASPALAGRELTSVAHSPFTRALYVASGAGADWRIDRFEVDASAAKLSAGAKVHTAATRIEALRIPYLTWSKHERLFFAQEHAPGRFQILSTRSDGQMRYEVTSATGQRGTLTSPSLLLAKDNQDPSGRQAPRVHKADSARPHVVESHDGTLLAEGADGQHFALAYAKNWGVAQPLGAAKGARYVSSPNGHYRFRWTPGRPGLEVVSAQGAAVDTLAKGTVFASAPELSPSGRTFVAAVSDARGARLESFAVTTPLAAVRYLPALRPDAPTLAALAARGISHRRTSSDQLYKPYEALRYDACHQNVQVPIFASIDGFLEVLHAGFQAVFMLGEQHLSRPRLQTFLTTLEGAAKKAGKPRVAQIAATAGKLLAGDLAHPEGQLVRAERKAKSALHTVGVDEIDFQDFHPRGPYTATDALMSYFRAFKYINLLTLKPDEAAALRGDAAVVAAWRNWVDVQAPYLSGSRQETWFGGKSTLAPHLRADCIPARISKAPPLVFPLSWGIDSEIFESTVERAGVAPDCSVPLRLMPSGVDLLAGLGSDEAAAVSTAAYAEFPALKVAHATLRKRFARFATKGFPNAWLGLVQRLTQDAYVPEGVAPSVWRRRLMQTALASWTSFRHTTVLVNATSGAECGDSFEGFERLEAEPVRGAVDPVPAAWSGVGELLRALANHARKLTVQERDGLVKVLTQAALRAAAFGGMATRQLKGQPLEQDEYNAIQKFAGEIEHPFVLLKSAIARREEGTQGDAAVPPPMMKIVDIHQGAPGTFLHMAVGPPLTVEVLLGDRGILTPASGAVYSYFEVIDKVRLDDDIWRKRLTKGDVQAPEWTPPLTAPGAAKAAE